jgi:hypothetical protein
MFILLAARAERPIPIRNKRFGGPVYSVIA